MKSTKTITIYTIVLHAFIIVLGGHGGGFIGLIEFAFLPEIIKHGFDRGNPIDLCFAFTVIGQLLLIVNLKIKNVFVSVVGVCVLLVALIVLNNEISFYSGIPFMICGACLIIRESITFIKANDAAKPK